MSDKPMPSAQRHHWWHELILIGSVYPATRPSMTAPVSIPTWRCVRCPGWERDA